jgi:hypothetical protein
MLAEIKARMFDHLVKNQVLQPEVPFPSCFDKRARPHTHTHKALLNVFSFMMSERYVSTDFVLKHSTVYDIILSVYMAVMLLFTQ